MSSDCTGGRQQSPQLTKFKSGNCQLPKQLQMKSAVCHFAQNLPLGTDNLALHESKLSVMDSSTSSAPISRIWIRELT